MDLSRRVAVAALAIALALAAIAVAGCGKTVIDPVKTEEALQHNLETTQNAKVKSVECPSDVEVVPNATFECTVNEAGGKQQTAKFKILNKDADVTVVDLSPSK